MPSKKESRPDVKLPIEAIARASDLHPRPNRQEQFKYGTAGFRMNATLLDSVVFRVGVLAALRSKRLEGKTVGIMITASHNPPQDNGVKIVDPRGEMLEAVWEVYATDLANATSTRQFIAMLDDLVRSLDIDLSIPAFVLHARDTRTSGPDLAAALEDGIRCMGGDMRNEGVTTTPILHYLTRAKNAKGTAEDCGDDTEEAYFETMGKAFQMLAEGKPAPPPLMVDCANGVGYDAITKLGPHVGPWLTFIPKGTDLSTPGSLNSFVGADFVKTNQKLPDELRDFMKPGTRACSLDGDADRLIYYYHDDRGMFRLLDGDKIATLAVVWLKDIVVTTGLEKQITVGVVQTAYANGSSTDYIKARAPVKIVPTGVKYLHHAAQKFGIGIYFEANGHGTVLFSPETIALLNATEPKNPSQDKAIRQLFSLRDMINQTVGDSLSDILLVELALAHIGYTTYEWDSLYLDLPNRLVKVPVLDLHRYVTEDSERKLVSPPGLQVVIDKTCRKYENGRSFVRPSGTENCVRVYAEANTRIEADELAYTIAGKVFDADQGEEGQSKRPKEFL